MRERLTSWTDRWIHAGSTTRTSLGRFRVLYAVYALTWTADFHWVAAFPDAMYNPPLGPMMLFGGFPPSAVLRGLEALFAVSLVAVLLGWRTRTASWTATVVGVLGFGFTYSSGKINHDILLLLLPGVISSAGWGDRASLDALARRRAGRAQVPERALQWPLRLMALMVGLSFFTAAAPKLRGGWLDPSSQAVQAFQVDQYYTQGRTDLLADFFLTLRAPLLWEAMDWATIVLEAGMVLFVLTWRGTRVAFAAATLFHVGVYLMMNINFSNNVVVYGFVAAWDRVPLPRWEPSPAAAARWLRAAPVVVLAGGTGWWALGALPPDLDRVRGWTVLTVGALVSTYYAGWLVHRLLGRPAGPVGGRLVYDGDCGFCTRSAQWLARRRPDRVDAVTWQSLPDLAALGLSEDDVAQRAYWQGSTGALQPGSRAIAAAAVARGGAAAVGGRVLQSEPVAPLAALVYRWVAEHRYRMPGSTDACRVPQPGATARGPRHGGA